MSSPGSGDPEEKSNPSSNGSKSHVLTRKKSASSSDRTRLKQCQSESASSNAKNASESSDSETGPRQDASARVLSPRKTKSAGKGGLRKRNSKRVAERVLVCLRKRRKMMASDSDSIASGSLLSGDMKLRSKLQKENEDAASSSQKKLKSPVIGRPRRKDVTIEESHNLVQGEVPDAPSSEMTIDPSPTNNNDTSRKEEFVDENTCKQELSEDRSWKALEKGLYEKGLEIFGRNRSVDVIAINWPF